MYTVFTRLTDGELLLVASRDNLDQAIHLARELKTNWPREYFVKDSEGHKFELDDRSLN